jgi:hypothetical protein
MADGCILEALWTPRKCHIRSECFGEGTALTRNVVSSTFLLLTGVVQSVVMAAARVMFAGHFAAIVAHDLAVECSRVSVALSVEVPVCK